MRMEDRTRKRQTVFSLNSGDCCLYEGNVYMKIGGGYDCVLLTDNPTEHSIGGIYDMRGVDVYKVNAKIVIEQFDN